MSEYRLMRFTRVVLYRAGSCKGCTPSFNWHHRRQ